MIAPRARACLDACVLYQACLRDTLLRLHEANIIHAFFTKQILEEMGLALRRTKKVSDAGVAYLVKLINQYFKSSFVLGYQGLIPAMKNNVGDRHVAAAAAKADAVIVTFNTRHFQNLPNYIIVQTPDEFLCQLWETNAQEIYRVLQQQAQDLKNPPITLEQMLARLARRCPRFAAQVIG